MCFFKFNFDVGVEFVTFSPFIAIGFLFGFLILPVVGLMIFDVFWTRSRAGRAFKKDREAHERVEARRRFYSERLRLAARRRVKRK